MSAALAALAASVSSANPFLWYVTRAAAVSAYITLSTAVILGLYRSLAPAMRVRIPWELDEAHQFLALLTAAFLALHLLSLVFDPLIPFAPLNLLVPLGEPYRPLAVGIGVFALYAVLVVLLSSWLRQRIAHATWRTLHYTSFAAFLLVTLHGLFAGTDSGEPWMRLVYLAAAGIVGLLTARRVFARRVFAPPRPQPARQLVARSSVSHNSRR
jgi:predicted ferric reductase